MNKVVSEAEIKIHVPTLSNKLLEKVVKQINDNVEVYTLWKVVNTNALKRIGFSDHGPVHFQIVSNVALRFARILTKNKIEMSVVRDFGLTNDHAEVVIFLASILHDVGMSVARDGHEEFSLFIVNNLLREILNFMSIEERTIVISETLHAIISHRDDGKPVTIEAGIVRIADALDMTKGRSRIPVEQGVIGIHAISAAAINKVDINEGGKVPVQISIEMNNSSGVFQIDDLLKSKIKGSGLEKYIEVKAYIKGGKEDNLIKEFSL